MKSFFSNKNTWIAMGLGAIVLFIILYATGKQTLVAKPTTAALDTTVLPPAQ